MDQPLAEWARRDAHFHWPRGTCRDARDRDLSRRECPVALRGARQSRIECADPDRPFRIDLMRHEASGAERVL